MLATLVKFVIRLQQIQWFEANLHETMGYPTKIVVRVGLILKVGYDKVYWEETL